MKKFVYIAAAAALALVGCSKSTTTPVVEEDSLIVMAPVHAKTATTKAALNGTTFPTSESFGSMAYYYEGDATKGSSYIPVQEISYKEDFSLWTTENPYFWPKKDGAILKFYSFYPYAVNSLISVDETATYGLKVENYTPDTYPEYDLMLADKVEDGTKKKYGENGVTTKFHHLLSYIAEIRIRTSKDASKTQTFTLNSISLESVLPTGTYVTEWTTSGTAAEKSLFSSEDGLKFGYAEDEKEGEEVTIGKLGYCFLIPQATNKMIVKYTVTTGETTEVVPQEIDLSEKFDSFVEGNKYIFYLTVGIDQILWNASIANDWTTVESSITVE